MIYPQDKIKMIGQPLIPVLEGEYNKYSSFVANKELTDKEKREFEDFWDQYKLDKKIPFQNELTCFEFPPEISSKKQLHPEARKEKEIFLKNQVFVKKLPAVSKELIQNLRKDIIRALNLNKIFNEYVKIPGTKHNELDIFPITGMYFTPTFLELIEQNQDAIKDYMKNFLSLDENDDIYVSPHIYRVEEGQSGTFLHNDFNQHVIDNFDSVESFKYGRKVLFYHLALTDITDQTCNLVIYPGTHNEFVTYPYALKFIIDNQLFNDEIEEKNLLKAFYLSQKGLNGLPGRLCILDKYYLYKYKHGVNGFTAFVNTGEGIFFNPFTLHSSLIPHAEKDPRITVAIRMTNRPTKFLKPQFFDFLTHSLAEIFNISYDELINALYGTQQANRDQYLEILISGNKNKTTPNITIEGMRNLFKKCSQFFYDEELNVSAQTMEKVRLYLQKYDT